MAKTLWGRQNSVEGRRGAERNRGAYWAEILGDKQRCVFEAAKMLKEYFLLQNAFHPVDAYCPIEKTYKMLGTLLRFYEKTKSAIEVGVPLTKILSLPVRQDLGRLKIISMDEFDAANTRINKEIDEQFDQLTSVTEDGGEVE